MLAAFAGTGLALGLFQWLAPAADAKDRPRGEAAARADCPQLDDLDPAYAALDVDALEARFVNESIMPPSMASESLRRFETSFEALKPSERACSRRVTLIHQVAMFAKMRARGGEHWYLARESSELESLFMTVALQRGWSSDQRVRALDHARAMSLHTTPRQHTTSTLAAADLEHERRGHVGRLIACEATGDELERIGGRHERGCADLTYVVSPTELAHGRSSPRREITPTTRASKPRPKERRPAPYRPPSIQPSTHPSTQPPPLVIPEQFQRF
jgi:hypothetical protein